MTALGDQAAMLRRNVWRYFEGLTGDELHWEPVAELWRSVLDHFVEVVRSLSEERLASPSPVMDGKATYANLVSHATLEIALHSAEIGTMRHLYREMDGSR